MRSAIELTSAGIWNRRRKAAENPSRTGPGRARIERCSCSIVVASSGRSLGGVAATGWGWWWGPGGVGDTPAGFLIPADQLFALVDATAGEGLALPAIKAKDPVGLTDEPPALEIGDAAAALFPLADVTTIEGCRKGIDLFWRKAGRPQGGEAMAIGGLGLPQGLQHRPTRRCGAGGGGGGTGGGDGHGDEGRWCCRDH